jgi:RNA-directed DNA polymerase
VSQMISPGKMPTRDQPGTRLMAPGLITEPVMGLTLNEQKTRVCNGRRESFDFLGYTFGPMRYRKDGRRYTGAAPAKKAVQRVKGRIRQILHPGNQAPWDEVKEELNRVLRGWAHYFSYGIRLMAYRAVDHYVYDRAQHILRRPDLYTTALALHSTS